MSITFPSDLEATVQRLVESGRYHDSEAVLREAVRLLDEIEQKRTGLDAMLQEASTRPTTVRLTGGRRNCGIDSGEKRPRCRTQRRAGPGCRPVGRGTSTLFERTGRRTISDPNTLACCLDGQTPNPPC